MKLKYKRSWLAVVLACVLFAGMLCLPQTARAVDPETNTLALSYTFEGTALENVTFRLYRVASVNREKLTVHPVAPYDKYNVLNGAGDWYSKATTLAGYVSRDRLEPTVEEKKTDETGYVRFSGLEDGMYLIVGESHSQGGYTYIPTPYLLFLPNTTDGYSWTRTVTSAVKCERFVPGEPTVQRRVLKVWEDEGNEADRPESVTVDLLANGEVYDTVTLSAGNNWRHHWTGLAAGTQWQVVERETPGYTVSAVENGITFVLTNTWRDETDITDPDVPLEDKPTEDDGTDILDEDIPLANLPQTGQLWWPVPILTMAGLLLLILGVARRRRSAWDEE